MKKSLLTLFLASSLFSLAQNAPEMNLCMVTVAADADYNEVIWERADQISSVGIDSVLIYRRAWNESSFTLIDAQSWADTSYYKDLTADPNQGYYTYGIAGKDINGQVGAMSDTATTIHLSYVMDTVLGQIQLSWNPYLTSSFDDYICWDRLPAQNVNLFNGTMTSWAFTPTNGLVYGQNYEFMIDCSNFASCTSSRANHNTTRSNRKAGAILAPTNITESNLVGFSLYPNPAHDKLNVTFSSLETSNSSIQIIDLLGNIVHRIPGNLYYGNQRIDIDVDRLPAGVYFVQIDNEGHIHSKKFIKK